MDDIEKTGVNWRAWLQDRPEFLMAALILALMGLTVVLASFSVCKA